MHFPYRLCVIFAAAVLLQSASASPVTTVLPDAQYNMNAFSSYCAGFNCDTPYLRSIAGVVPTTLQVGCSAVVGDVNCAGSSLSAAPAPLLSVTVSTSLNHTDQSSEADAKVSYYYEIVCPTCAVGTIVPMSIGGSMEAHYIQGILPANGAVTITDLSRVFVNGYDPMTSRDNVTVDMAMEGLEASSLVAGAPNGFGFCESTWTGYNNCSGGPSSPYGVPFKAIVNEQYSIFLDAQASIHAINQPFATDYAETTLDPVLSFGLGFDSTGYSIALSPGIGNAASTVPEPATWTLLSTAALAWVSGHMLRLRRRR